MYIYVRVGHGSRPNSNPIHGWIQSMSNSGVCVCGSGNAGEPSGNWSKHRGACDHAAHGLWPRVRFVLGGRSPPPAASVRGYQPQKTFLRLYMQTPAIFYRAFLARNAVHNAFLDTLTVGTPFPFVPAAFQQWERRCHAFRFEITPSVRRHTGIGLS